MSKLSKLSIFAVVIAIAIGFAFNISPAQAAESGEFDLQVSHRINGRSLGLSKELPVDVYVNGGLAIPGFEFGDVVETSLPAGTYSIVVKLAGTDTAVMSLGPVEIYDGAEVSIRATLGAEKSPTLRAKIK